MLGISGFCLYKQLQLQLQLKANRCPPVLGTNPTETLCEGRKDREAEEREWPEHKVILANCVKL